MNTGTKPEEKDKKITPKKEVLEEPKLKSKLKSVRKSEIEETPMEKLKRLENSEYQRLNHKDGKALLFS